MLRTMMKSKIHRATVTGACLDYVGSITLDPLLMAEADMLEYEQVAVVDIDNGNRFETYVIEGTEGSREVCVNGAAARLVQRGDRVIVVSYGIYSPEEVAVHDPRVVHVDEDNRILRVDADPSALAAQP